MESSNNCARIVELKEIRNIMEKEVQITVIGVHGEDSEQSQNMGTYYKKSGKHYVFYDERVSAEGDLVRNYLRFDEDFVTLQKNGTLRTEMLFERSKKYPMDYHTPYGSFQFQIDTKEIWIEEEEDQLKLTIQYQMEMDEETRDECRITIHIQSKKQEQTL